MLSDQRPDRNVLGHLVPEWLKDAPVFSLAICCRPRRRNHLAREPLATRLFHTVEFYHDQGIWFPEFMVLMPDHLHLMVSFAREISMKKTVKNWKRYAKVNFGISWQDGFFDHRIRSNEDHDDEWRYYLRNPVEAGLVDDLDAWPYKRIWKQQG